MGGSVFKSSPEKHVEKEECMGREMPCGKKRRRLGAGGDMTPSKGTFFSPRSERVKEVTTTSLGWQDLSIRDRGGKRKRLKPPNMIFRCALSD